MHQVGSSSCNTRNRPFQRPRCSDSSRRKDPRQARVTIQIHQIASYPWKRDCSGPALSPHENLSPAGHQLRPSIMAIRHNPFAEIFEVRVEPPIFRSTSRVTKILSSTCHRSPELRWLHIGAYHFCILCKSEKYPIWTSSLGLDRNWVEWSWHNTTVCPKCHVSKYHTRLQERWKNKKQ